PHRSLVAQVTHHRARVDAGDADDALAHQLVLEGTAGGAPVRHAPGRFPDGVAGHPDAVVGPAVAAAGLAVLRVPAGVADLRGRGHHDLAVVARVGEGLLVAGHAGAEHG